MHAVLHGLCMQETTQSNVHFQPFGTGERLALFCMLDGYCAKFPPFGADEMYFFAVCLCGSHS